MKLDDDDWALSMKISRRGRGESAESESLLRSLLVHRLTPTLKAILRRPLRGGLFGLYCEHCEQWTQLDHAPVVAECPTCERRYRLELAVYEEIDE